MHTIADTAKPANTQPPKHTPTFATRIGSSAKSVHTREVFRAFHPSAKPRHASPQKHLFVWEKTVSALALGARRWGHEQKPEHNENGHTYLLLPKPLFLLFFLETVARLVPLRRNTRDKGSLPRKKNVPMEPKAAQPSRVCTVEVAFTEHASERWPSKVAGAANVVGLCVIGRKVLRLSVAVNVHELSRTCAVRVVGKTDRIFFPAAFLWGRSTTLARTRSPTKKKATTRHRQ